MSKHNRDRRKYRCPCGNPFDKRHVEMGEASFAYSKARGFKLPEKLPHSCGTCRKLSCLDGGRFRYLTAAEELKYRVEFEHAASFSDWAMRTNAPDCTGLIPIYKEPN